MKEEDMKQTNLVPLKSFKHYPLDEMQRRADEFYRDLDRRRTIRDFTDDPVPRNVIENCLKAADTAPSGANQHPWHHLSLLKTRRLNQKSENWLRKKNGSFMKKEHHRNGLMPWLPWELMRTNLFWKQPLF